MIVVTGAAGFIASQLAKGLNENGYRDLVLVDDFSREDKKYNYKDLDYKELIERSELESWLKSQSNIDIIFHLGARTDTAEFDQDIFDELNLNYSKMVWNWCTRNNTPLVYASSAATYGDGSHGYIDNHTIIPKLEPLNPYGASKQQFDLWVLEQKQTPPNWYGLKFFNVYGPGEYHKGRMASVVYHAYNQIASTGKMKLFRSHHPDFKDGEQKRDFIYVKDIVNVCLFLYNERPHNGIYNLGSGQARTFLNLVKSTFQAMGKQPDIEFIDTPEDIRDKYQYFTEAAMDKLISAGYKDGFSSLEDGVQDYVTNYLMQR